MYNFSTQNGKLTAIIILHFHLQPQFKYELFLIYLASFHSSRKIWTQLIGLAPNVWLHSSVGRASHRYRGGHVFESRWSPDFSSSFQLLKLENLLRWSHFTFTFFVADNWLGPRSEKLAFMQVHTKSNPSVISIYIQRTTRIHLLSESPGSLTGTSNLYRYTHYRQFTSSCRKTRLINNRSYLYSTVSPC